MSHACFSSHIRPDFFYFTGLLFSTFVPPLYACSHLWPDFFYITSSHAYDGQQNCFTHLRAVRVLHDRDNFFYFNRLIYFTFVIFYVRSYCSEHGLLLIIVNTKLPQKYHKVTRKRCSRVVAGHSRKGPISPRYHMFPRCFTTCSLDVSLRDALRDSPACFPDCGVQDGAARGAPPARSGRPPRRATADVLPHLPVNKHVRSRKY